MSLADILGIFASVVTIFSAGVAVGVHISKK